MREREDCPKYVTWQAREGLELLLTFAEEAGQLEQDWEYVAGDPERIDEFLNVYEQAELTIDERFALMIIIISSYDDWLSTASESRDEWPRIAAHLVRNSSIHWNTVEYWSLLDEDDPENWWPSAPLMRGIWEEYRQCPEIV
ncbi:hypothetical protein QWJ34_10245 [Saccharibacillus sp. CPCC 101409]|uniref:hypothetical protein n=1 Tax=Saccharibacillus sp. CPCC 101409 TaxID=3058041 RepID=UPI002673644F|nr:hypothetical protein [Saccharibacillus sp. CPCC 101409]MDO3410141.1 hypothetical protein [Saccharibacillus sp. CPCC 101409]